MKATPFLMVVVVWFVRRVRPVGVVRPQTTLSDLDHSEEEDTVSAARCALRHRKRSRARLGLAAHSKLTETLRIIRLGKKQLKSVHFFGKPCFTLENWVSYASLIKQGFLEQW